MTNCINLVSVGILNAIRMQNTCVMSITSCRIYDNA